ncbi:MAG: hypothetical protein ACSI46_24575 [Gloeotrichia echinulata DVL01]|nr:hypothetical protein [Gloeotrichia echinulata DEX184]
MACVADFDPQNKTGDWGLGTLRQAQCIAGDWGLGIGDWGLGTGEGIVP